MMTPETKFRLDELLSETQADCREALTWVCVGAGVLVLFVIIGIVMAMAKNPDYLKTALSGLPSLAGVPKPLRDLYRYQRLLGRLTRYRRTLSELSTGDPIAVNIKKWIDAQYAALAAGDRAEA